MPTIKRGPAMWCKACFFLLALWEAVVGLLCWALSFGRWTTHEQPRVTAATTPTNRRILSACTRLRFFRACPWASGAAAQMVVANLKPSPMRSPFSRESLVLEDGVLVALDWQHRGVDGTTELPEDEPLVVCAHGLGGDSTSTYLRVFAEACRARGWRCVVYNRRGHARMSVLPSMTSLATGAAGTSTDSLLADGSTSGRMQKDIGRTASEVNSQSGDEDEGGYLARTATPTDLNLSIALTADAQAAVTQSAIVAEPVSCCGLMSTAAITAAAGACSNSSTASAPGSTVKATAKVAKVFPKHSDIEDMEEVVAHICRRFPAAPKVLVGFSAGSNLTVQYCGAVNTYPRNPFLAAVSISNAHNLMKATRLLKARPLSDALMTAFLQEKLHEGLADIRLMAERHGVRLDFRRLMSTCHFREFEELMICPIYGYASLDDYYREVSSGKDFQNVRLPLLSLANLDDPIIHPDMTEVAVEAARSNPHVISVVTERGGHLGWQHGWACEPWMHQLVEQFVAEVFSMHFEKSGAKPVVQPTQALEAVEARGHHDSAAGGNSAPGVEGLRHRRAAPGMRA